MTAMQMSKWRDKEIQELLSARANAEIFRHIEGPVTLCHYCPDKHFKHFTEPIHSTQPNKKSFFKRCTATGQRGNGDCTTAIP